MKLVLRWCAVLLLAMPLVAQTAAKPKKKAVAPAAAPAVTAQDVQSLRDALAAQQRQIEELKQLVQQQNQSMQQSQQQLQQAQTAATEAQQKAATAASTADAQQSTVTQLSSDVADVKTALTNSATDKQDEQKRFSALEGLVGRFRFSGDVRVRGESFFQGVGPDAAPGTATTDRQRGRIRVRLGLDGKLNDDFTAGVYLATGSLGDPTSTNETLTNFFDRKTISLDRGFITYNPVAHKWLSLTGGKFAFTWIRTPQTFDNDLNPEGFSQKVSFDLKGHYLKNFTFTAMQLLFNESSGGSDSFATGGQVSGRLQFGPVTTTPSFSLLKWNGLDALLNASAFSVAASPGEGPGCKSTSGVPTTSCVFASNNFTNATYLDAAGKPHFLSRFNYADLIISNVIKTPAPRMPVNVVLEYLNNLDAADHPKDSTNAIATNLGKQSHMYLADVSVGQARNKNDIQVGYTWVRQEQDSAISSFVESDDRTQTNVLQNKIYGIWKVRNNVNAQFTMYIGRTLNSNLQHATLVTGVPLGTTEPNLKRMQFDLIYSF